MIKLTKKDQYKHISGGVALGLMMNGVSQLPADKIAIELAFVKAWRRWQYRQHYSWMTRIASGKKDLDVIHIITYLNERTRVPYLGYYWEFYGGPGPTINFHEHTSFNTEDSNDIEHAASTIGQQQGIPASAWSDLASKFLVILEE